MSAPMHCADCVLTAGIAAEMGLPKRPVREATVSFTEADGITAAGVCAEHAAARADSPYLLINASKKEGRS